MPTFPEIDDFRVSTTEIDGLFLISARSIADERGQIREVFRRGVFTDRIPGMPASWAQFNLTKTHFGAVRGLHGEAMTKMVTVASGSAFGVYLDARASSPTLGRIVTVELRPGTQVLVPAGVCNGFQATAEGPAVSPVVQVFRALRQKTTGEMGFSARTTCTTGVAYGCSSEFSRERVAAEQQAGMRPLAAGE